MCMLLYLYLCSLQQKEHLNRLFVLMVNKDIQVIQSSVFLFIGIYWNQAEKQ